MNITKLQTFYFITKYSTRFDKRGNLPWFTNSEELLTLPATLLWLRVRFDVLIDEMLRWDWMVLLSKSHVLVLQKPSDMLGFLTTRPWILSPLDGSSTAIIGVGLVQHPKQPLHCYKPNKALYDIKLQQKHSMCTWSSTMLRQLSNNIIYGSLKIWRCKHTTIDNRNYENAYYKLNEVWPSKKLKY